MSDKISISIENLIKKIGGNVVLDNISLEMSAGKIYGLRGKNGCGKTMLMRVICGFVKPTEGLVRINEKILYKDAEFPTSIGALIESPVFLDEYSGVENLSLLQRLYKKIDYDSIGLALDRVGLGEERNKKYYKYSLGMKQKLGIAFAIMDEPDIIVLDEPINALDEGSVAMIKKTLFKLRDDGKLIIVACHDREEMNELADVVYVMVDGKVVGVE